MVLEGGKMTVLEILKIASNYLNLEEEFEPFFESSSQGNAISEQTQAKYNKLLLAFNNIISEIAMTKYPLIKVAQVNAISGENQIGLILDLSDVGKVIKVSTKDGQPLVFLQTNDKIVFKTQASGVVYIEYCAIPKIYKADDDLNEFNSLDKRVIALGIAGEYLYLNEIYDDSEVFRKEYEKGLKKYARNGKVMPRRKFV